MVQKMKRKRNKIFFNQPKLFLMSKHPLYRKSTLGTTLEESMLDLIEDDKMSESLSRIVFEEFDKSVFNFSLNQNRFILFSNFQRFQNI
jgi:hypothetical protein